MTPQAAAVPAAGGALFVPAGVAHLWTVDLRRPQWQDTAFALLATDEQERAMRFRFDRDRRRFTIARGALRCVLGRYLAQPAADIVLAYGPNGKPALTRAGPQFNIAHSEELAVIALSAETPLGVDVERLDRRVDLDLLIAGSASAQEQSAFAALPAGSRRAALFHWWTRKEALLKALGDGLSLALDGFDVTIVPGDARLTGSRLAEISGAWSLQDIAPAAGFVGAVAIRGAALALDMRPFDFGNR